MHTSLRSRPPAALTGLLVLLLTVAVLPASEALAKYQTPGDTYSTDAGEPHLGGDSDLGGPPSGVVAADFDGDGQDDLAATTSERHGPEETWRFHDGVSVLLSQSDGSYSDAIYYPLGFEVRSYNNGTPVPCCLFPRVGEDGAVDVTAADLNGDGFPDLAAVNVTTASVSVLMNTGTGAFAPPVTYRLEDPADFTDNRSPRAIADVDLDGDGDVDLVTANARGTVSVLDNTGVGVYQEKSASPYATNSSDVEGLAVGDVDGDGDPDVVTANDRPEDVSVLRNDGNGGLSPQANSPYAIDSASSSPVAVDVADLDGDRHADVVTANEGSHDVSVLLSDSTASLTLQSGSPYTVGSNPVDVKLTNADPDQDGDTDVVTANSGSANVTLLLNDGSANLSEETSSPYKTQKKPLSLAVGKLDRPGSSGNDPDLGVANARSQSLSVFLNIAKSN